MPPLVLHVLPDPVALLRAAADEAHTFRMEGVLLALRQRGIRDDLYRMAGEAGCPGWFDPRVCTFHELPGRLGGSTRVMLSDDGRAVLLERLFVTHVGGVFSHLLRPAEFVDPVDTLFGELCGRRSYTRSVRCGYSSCAGARGVGRRAESRFLTVERRPLEAYAVLVEAGV